MRENQFLEIRWVTFKIGTITDVRFTIRLKSCNGFDNANVQTSDGFEMYAKVMDGSTEVTKWVDCNATFNGGSPGDLSGVDGVAAVSSFTNTATANGDFLRTITFGALEPKPSGDVYVRVGWNVGGDTDPENTGAGSGGTRMFKYIELV